MSAHAPLMYLGFGRRPGAVLLDALCTVLVLVQVGLVIGHRRHRALHDFIAGTVVVRA